jgi:hypothetical protein
VPEYVVEFWGETVVDPFGPTEPTWEMAPPVAFEDDHESVALPPRVMVEGETESEHDGGGLSMVHELY